MREPRGCRGKSHHPQCRLRVGYCESKCLTHTHTLSTAQIDTEFQKHKPTQHTIIEAHPDVLKHMRETGWYDKPGVRVCEGKWQDFIEELGQFDVIYVSVRE